MGSGFPGSDRTHRYPDPLFGAEGCQNVENLDANAGISLFFSEDVASAIVLVAVEGRCGAKRVAMYSAALTTSTLLGANAPVTAVSVVVAADSSSSELCVLIMSKYFDEVRSGAVEVELAAVVVAAVVVVVAAVMRVVMEAAAVLGWVVLGASAPVLPRLWCPLFAAKLDFLLEGLFIRLNADTTTSPGGGAAARRAPPAPPLAAAASELLRWDGVLLCRPFDRI